MAIFATFGLATQGASFRFPPQVREQLTSVGWSSDCLFQKTDGPIGFPVPGCTFGSGPHRAALLGDSVAASFAPALVQHFKPRGVVLSQMTHGLCYHARHSVWDGALADPCPGFIARAIEHINAAGYDLVIVTASWPSSNQDVRIDGRVAPQFDDETAETLAADISDTMHMTETGSSKLIDWPQLRAMLP